MAAARVEQQNLARPGLNALPVGADTAAAAQHHAQLQLLMQVHGAVHHVDDKHGAVGQLGMGDQLIFIVKFHLFHQKRIFVGRQAHLHR